MAQEKRIKVEASVNAPVEKVWKVWNTPEDIKKWNTPDPSWHSPRSENDLREGGKFKTRMEARDGSSGFDFEGVYEKVKLHQEISYALSDGRKVTTLFAGQDGKTHVQTIFDAETENDPEFQKQGWQAILNNFAKYAETGNL